MLNPLTLKLIRNKEYQLGEMLEYYDESIVSSLVGYKPMISFKLPTISNEEVVLGDMFYCPELKTVFMPTLLSSEKEMNAINSYGFYIQEFKYHKQMIYHTLLDMTIKCYFEEDEFLKNKIYIGNVYVDKNIKNKIEEIATKYNLDIDVVLNMYKEFNDYQSTIYNANIDLRLTYEYKHPVGKFYQETGRLSGLTSIVKQLVTNQKWSPLLHKEFNYLNEEMIHHKFKHEYNSPYGNVINAYCDSLHFLNENTFKDIERHIKSFHDGYNKEYFLNVARFYSNFIINLNKETGLIECVSLYNFNKNDNVDVEDDVIVYCPGSYNLNKYHPYAYCDFNNDEQKEYFADKYNDSLLKII